MTLIDAFGGLLESHVVEEALLFAADHGFYGGIVTFAFRAFPAVPALIEDGFDFAALELDRDEKLSPLVEHGIDSDEEASFEINPYHESGVELERVLPDFMKLPVFLPILDLETMLIRRPILGHFRVCEKGIDDDAVLLAHWIFESDAEWCVSGVGC